MMQQNGVLLFVADDSFSRVLMYLQRIKQMMIHPEILGMLFKLHAWRG